MITPGQTLENPVTGERFTFTHTAGSTNGELLAFDFALRPGGAVPIPHVHPIQTEPYEVRLVSFRAKKEPAHLRLHPFGLIPTYEEGDLALFETGAIVFHIADHHAGLFPDDANARARAITWMFAALNTVEPPILELATARFAEGDKPWAEERLPLVRDRIRDRLVQLSTHLGDADWLDGDFSAGDLMMVSVLLRLRPSGLLDELPKLAAYVARGEARPAYERAFAAQWAINAGHSQAVGRGRGQHDQTSDPEAGI
jgi:glutathione S-transferase